jgi:thiol:disulfide interchange protein DsbC
MRRILICATVLLLTASFQGNVLAFSKNGQDCSKCHTLNADQAKDILDDLIPNVKIIHVQQAPVTGLWEIGIDAGGRKAIVYLDYAKKHIISPATGGNVISIKAKSNLTQESFQKINKVDVSLIPLKDALVMGDSAAKHKIVVFDDPD